MATEKFCPRCGKPGTDASTATDEIYVCSGGSHGVIYKAAKPVEEAAAAEAAAPVEVEPKPKREPKPLN